MGLALADWDTGPTGSCKDCLVAQGAGKANLAVNNVDTFNRRYILRARATTANTGISVTLFITATIFPSGGSAPGLKNCASNQSAPMAGINVSVAKVSCEIEIPPGQNVVIVATATGGSNREDVELLAVPKGNF
jgi:hypothetical protein